MAGIPPIRHAAWSSASTAVTRLIVCCNLLCRRVAAEWIAALRGTIEPHLNPARGSIHAWLPHDRAGKSFLVVFSGAADGSAGDQPAGPIHPSAAHREQASFLIVFSDRAAAAGLRPLIVGKTPWPSAHRKRDMRWCTPIAYPFSGISFPLSLWERGRARPPRRPRRGPGLCAAIAHACATRRRRGVRGAHQRATA
jgi:hypothetical protein